MHTSYLASANWWLGVAVAEILIGIFALIACEFLEETDLLPQVRPVLTIIGRGFIFGPFVQLVYVLWFLE